MSNIPSKETLQHRAVRRASCTKIEFSIAVRRLLKSEYIEHVRVSDDFEQFSYLGVRLTAQAWELLDKNPDVFVFQQKKP